MTCKLKKSTSYPNTACKEQTQHSGIIIKYYFHDQLHCNNMY